MARTLTPKRAYAAVVLISDRVGFLRFFFMNKFSGDSWMYPYQRTPTGNPYIRVCMGYFIPREHQLNTMGTYVTGTPVLVPWHFQWKRLGWKKYPSSNIICLPNKLIFSATAKMMFLVLYDNGNFLSDLCYFSLEQHQQNPEMTFPEILIGSWRDPYYRVYFNLCI